MRRKHAPRHRGGRIGCVHIATRVFFTEDHLGNTSTNRANRRERRKLPFYRPYGNREGFALVAPPIHPTTRSTGGATGRKPLRRARKGLGKNQRILSRSLTKTESPDFKRS